MTQVANYFNDVANYHKQKFELANSMAAATLMQVSMISIASILPLFHRHFSLFFIFDADALKPSPIFFLFAPLQIHAANCQNNDTVDLHFLRVTEAKESLDLFLDSHIQKLRESNNRGIQQHTLFIITGRGLHSSGGPRVKPAVKRRLRERGLM